MVVVVVVALIVVALAMLPVAVYLGLEPDTGRRAWFVRGTAFVDLAAVTAVIGLVFAADAVGSPGGWRAALLIGGSLAVIAGLGALSWSRPELAVRVLPIVIGLVIAASVTFAVDTGPWWELENREGPVRAVLTLVVAAGIAPLGLRRPLAAGLLLLGLGMIPPAVSSLGGRSGLAALAVVSIPAVVSGLLFVVAGLLDRAQPASAAGEEPLQAGAEERGMEGVAGPAAATERRPVEDEVGTVVGGEPRQLGRGDEQALVGAAAALGQREDDEQAAR